MTKCPWCKKYINAYLSPNSPLSDGFSEQDLEEERERLNRGFWASIAEVHDEQYLMNRVLDVKGALEMRMPIHIDMRSGRISFGRFWFYSLAELRDRVLKEELKHFWIPSGGCSMFWVTPICCELANVSSPEEQLTWELELFPSIANLTREVLKLMKEESY